MFAIWDTVDSDAVRLKVDPGVLPILCQQPGISPSPYLARQSWIKLDASDVLPQPEIEDLIRESHALVAARLSLRARRDLGIG